MSLASARWRRACQFLLGISALGVIVQAVFVAWRFRVVEPWMDDWFWVATFRRMTEDGFTWQDLFAFHNEHRIVTTRLVLLADSLWFHMLGWFPLIVNLLLLGGAGLAFGRLARVGPLPPLFWAAWFLSLCQFDNLILPFQVQFGFSIAASVAAVGLLALATVPGSRHPAAFSAGAGLAAVVGALSMASGLLLAPALALLAFLRRASLRAAAPALAMAGSAAATDLIGVPVALHHPVPIIDRASFALGFLGSAAGAVPMLARAVGLVAAAALAFFLASAVRRRPVPPATAALIALGTWVVLNAAAGAVTDRAYYGPAAALTPRYASMSLLLLAALAALAWREVTAAARPPWVALAAVAALLALNNPSYVRRAADFRLFVQANAEALRNGVDVTTPAMSLLLGDLPLGPLIAFLRANRLNLFAPTYGPPHSVLDAAARDTPVSLPACRGSVDSAMRLDDRAAILQGWLATPGRLRNVAWVVARDDGGIVGIARPRDGRGDVVAAMHAPIRGFSAFVRLHGSGAPAERWVSVSVFGSFGDGARRLCALPSPALLGPVEMVPEHALRHVAVLAAQPAGASGPPWQIDADEGRWLRFEIAAVPLGRAVGIRLTARPDTGGLAITFRMADGVSFSQKLPALQTGEEPYVVLLTPEVMRRHPGKLSITVRATPAVTADTVELVLAETIPGWSRLF